MKKTIIARDFEKKKELGAVLLEGGYAELALPHIEADVKANPDNPKHLINLGACLQELLQHEEALKVLQKASVMNPAHPFAWHNLGYCSEEMGRFGEAEAAYEKAHKLFPDWVNPMMGISSCKIRRGAFLDCLEEWEDHRHYIARLDDTLGLEQPLKGAIAELKKRGSESNLPFLKATLEAVQRIDRVEGLPELKGEDFGKDHRPLRLPIRLPYHRVPKRLLFASLRGLNQLAGKKIAVYAEGGAGDHFMFIRYLSALRIQGAHVTMIGFPNLKEILSSGLKFFDNWINTGDEFDTKNFDFGISLWSIPTVLKWLPMAMPQPYLGSMTKTMRSPFDARKKFWREEDPCVSEKFTVGIHCAVEEGTRLRWKPRLIPPRVLETLPRDMGIRYVGLQIADGLPSWIEDHRKKLQGWKATADFMQGCDLVISADTGACHLAGAQGIPVWTVLPVGSDWKWFLGRNDSPWYPAMQLFRSRKINDFGPVMKEVGAALADLVKDFQPPKSRTSPFAGEAAYA